MPIEILANHALSRSVDYQWADSTQEPLTDQTGRSNFTGGARHLLATSPVGTGFVRLQYVNNDTSAFGSFDRVVITNADLALTHKVEIVSATSFWGGHANLLSTTNFAETLIGPKSQDYLLSFSSISSKKALHVNLDDGTGGSWTKKIGKVFFSQALAFDYVAEGEPRRNPAFDAISIDGEKFLTQERIRLTFQSLTDSQVQSFHSLPGVWGKFRQPFFIYDSSAVYLAEKLLHVVLSDREVIKQSADFYTMSLDLYVLRYYDS